MASEYELPDLPPMVLESKLVQPPRRPSDKMPIKSVEEYYKLYEESIRDLGSYWASVANGIDWISGWPSNTNLEGDLASGFKFFKGAYGNVCYNCVDRHAEAKPKKLAIRWFGEDGRKVEWTYSDFWDVTARFAGALKRLGVNKGDVVAIFLPNLPEAFAAVHACYRIGALYNIIFSGFSAQALEDRIIDTGAKVVVTADETFRRGKVVPLKATLDSVLPNLPFVEKVVVVRRSGNKDVNMVEGRDLYWDELINEEQPLKDIEPIEANEPSFIIYTSGTSAKPKGLIHSGLGFLVGAYNQVRMTVDLTDDDMFWCTADVGWLTFPIWELVGATSVGASVIACEGALDFPSPDRFYSIIEENKVNKVFSAPTMLRLLARYGEEYPKKHDLSKLELIALVGEPFDSKTWYWVHEHIGDGKVEINNTYGQSETGSAWTSSIVGVTPAKPGSCGVALPGHAYAILDENGNEVRKGEVGYLVITKPFPALFRGIWRDPARYRKEYFSMFGPSIYVSGDAALEDHDGHIWVVGRVDGVINVSAHRLSTMEMESALLSVPWVSEAAVIGLPDPVKGQVPVGFVTLASGSEGKVTEQMLVDKIVEAIGPIARPQKIYFVSALPKTRSGKIVRRLLGELVTEGTAKGDITGLEDPEVLNRLKSELVGK